MHEAYTSVKICGITRPADREVAVAAGVDALGFISEVSVDTPRELSVDRARNLVADVPPFVTSVLVTMPESLSRALELDDRIAPDVLQIHGGLPPERIALLGDRIDAGVIAATDVDGDVEAYAEAADAVLIDSRDGSGGGGTGETHDWDRTEEYVTALETPVVLAGGLTPANVGEAIETVSPYGVDTATGVESDPGVKDHQAVEAFVRRTRRPEVRA